MSILYGLLTGMSVVLAFALGIMVGVLFLCPSCGGAGRKERLTAAEKNAGQPERITSPAEDASVRKAAEDQKAFIDCMNYSAETAYDWGNK